MIEQRSEEWFKLRDNRVTGSIAGAILGLNPWMSRVDVMRQKLGYKKFEGNAATEYGTFHEEYALNDFLMSYAHELVYSEAPFVVHPDHDWLGASPDGFIDDDAILEIKCPFRIKDDEKPKFKKLEEMPHYYAQVQIEMFCTCRSKAYFYQWNRFSNTLEIVSFDPDWIEKNFSALYDFWLEVQDRRKADDEDLTAKYERALAKLNDAKAEAEDARQAIINKAQLTKRDMVGRFKVKQYERKGNVQYKSIPELAGVDLDKYRSKPTKYWKIS